MENESIPEEDIEMMEICGNAHQWLQVSVVTKPFFYKITEIKVEKTEWGPRATLILDDEMMISSWNVVNKEKFKIGDLIGKKIKLSPYNEKKLLLEIC